MPFSPGVQQSSYLGPFIFTIYASYLGIASLTIFILRIQLFIFHWILTLN